MNKLKIKAEDCEMVAIFKAMLLSEISDTLKKIEKHLEKIANNDTISL